MNRISCTLNAGGVGTKQTGMGKEGELCSKREFVALAKKNNHKKVTL